MAIISPVTAEEAVSENLNIILSLSFYLSLYVCVCLPLYRSLRLDIGMSVPVCFSVCLTDWLNASTVYT